jgi:hypothetical protein
MDLARIDDMAENDFIGDQVITQACCPASLSADQPFPGLWLGGNDEQTEGLWVWEDDETPFWMGRYDYGTMENGAAIDGHFASWGVHQPDSGFDQEEDCLRTTGLLWNDTQCGLDPAPDPLNPPPAPPFVGLGYICEQLPTQ